MNFMAAVTICSDFGAPQNKSDTVYTVSPSISHEVVGPDALAPYIYTCIVFIYVHIYIHRYDCSHEIKRRLLLGRKVMTNLDSILKSRDITLSTKVHLVKAMVFSGVMYRCESWIIKKAEH